MQLYDIAQEGLVVADLLTESEGELTPELEARLDAVLRAGKEKIEAAERVCRNLDAQAKACAVEAKRLAERAQGIKKQRESLRKRMAVAIDAVFGGKVKTALFTIWTQTGAPTMRVTVAPGTDMDQLRARRPDLFRTEHIFDEIAAKTTKTTGMPLPAEVTVEDVPGNLFCKSR